MTLTKKELVLTVAKDTGITQVDVKRVVQRTLDFLVANLKEGKTVEFRNFGVFKVKQRAPRRGRNPKTGQEVPVPPKRVVVFKPGLIMRREIK
ncbi:MAG: integration host factor subunit beta [Candidatus Omnitrophica bacterium]|nr:integration host factor subunit beta [Candidatus Omnitrophota bacterium]MBI2174495.1 integration host factor subunit beta [Candidatus Omnitrophota bacterium]MBI3010086.1 integration host factor subunit beta [Candidatus Omnitrophota bacterium]